MERWWHRAAPRRAQRPPAHPTAQLAGGEFAPHLELLHIFAYGTWADYKGESGGGLGGRVEGKVGGERSGRATESSQYVRVRPPHPTPTRVSGCFIR